MSEFDKWEVAGVLPGDYEEFGDWIFQCSFPDVKIGGGIVYHKHVTNDDRGTKLTLFMAGSDKRCRQCGELVPLGIIFRARTYRLDNLGVE